MNNWEKNPIQMKRRGFDCNAARHLWPSGLTLAVYTTIGALTYGGDSPYAASVERMTEWLGCSERAASRAFRYLDQHGWLIVEADKPQNIYSLRFGTHAPKQRRYVSHDKWAESHPGQCYEREAMPWDGEVGDPLGRQLYRLSDCKLKWYPEQLKSLRTSGQSDSEILSVWKSMVENRRAERKQELEKGKIIGMAWKDMRWKFIHAVAGFKPVSG